MERKYFHARTVGSPEAVLQKITTSVNQAGLASEIPLVKLERRARGEFYVFLGVDSDEPYGIPGGLGKSLQNLGLWFDETWPLRPEEIKAMVQRQDIQIHGFSFLRYRQNEYADPGDPFDQPDIRTPQSGSPESCILMERFLHWLSAHGSGTWEGFRQACEVLQIALESHDIRSLLRRFVLLGHLDLSNDGSRWSAAEPVLVRFPENPEGAFLSGRRTVPFLQKMNQMCPLTETQQSQFDGPPRLDLALDARVGTANLGIVDAGITSNRLASLLPSLDEWKDSLQSLDDLAIASYQVERWQAAGFEPCETLYDRDGIYYGESGMYRIRREGDATKRTLTLFFDEFAQRWLRGDWYGLRFLSLVVSGSGAVAFYESVAKKLLVPGSQRWPLLYERALTMASGLLPERASNPDWLSYSNVSLDIARVLCTKLKVNLQEN